MGSFSISQEFAEKLLDVYSFELTQKLGKLDTDADLWMPLTLPKETFLKLFPQDEKRYDAVQHLREDFSFSIRDIGEKAWWWDFGTLYNYYHNCLKLLGTSIESSDLRHLFGHSQKHTGSLTIGCNLRGCEVKNSILLNVDAEAVLFDGALCIDSTLQQLSVIDSILYTVSSEKELFCETVRADVFDPVTKLRTPFYADLHQNAWDALLDKNSLSFKEQFEKNSSFALS